MSTNYFSTLIKDLDAEVKKFWHKDAPHPLLILLEGPLGAGKSTFVQEFFEHLGGSRDTVQSPTFLKVLEYSLPSVGKIIHIDTYRMEEPSDLNDVGFEFNDDAKIWFVEWPELFVKFLRQRSDLMSSLGFKDVIEVKIKMDPVLGSGPGGGGDTETQLKRRVFWSRKLMREVLKEKSIQSGA